MRPVFKALYLDIGWFGVLSGTTITFLNVYAARLGATAAQIGYLNAAPALAYTALSIPAGAWLHRGRGIRKVVLASFAHRIFYLVIVLVPLLASARTQISMILGVILLMSIPGTALQTGFNHLFAEAVPEDWRGWVAGNRNAFLAVISVTILVLSGQILGRTPFPTNYQVIFLLGFLGAMASSYYLLKVERLVESPVVELPWPAADPSAGEATAAPRFSLPSWQGHSAFYRVMGLLFVLNLGVYIAVPVFPIVWVRHLKLSDGVISIGSALFYVTSFLGSMRIAWLSRRFSNQKVVGFGAALMAFYPLILAQAQGPGLFYLASLVGGLAFSLVNGLLANYLLERLPVDQRPASLAVYNTLLYAAVLIGSLAGPWIGEAVGIATAMVIFAAIRAAAGLLIVWKG